jgi:acyl transferase domain-containing protein
VVVYRAARAEPLAIVGMACRFGGGVDSVGSLWDFLDGRGDAMGEIPRERFDWRKLYDPEPGRVGKMCTNRASLVDGSTLFDHNRFRISEAEARAMLPQQRLSLETAYEALLQAGVRKKVDDRRAIGTFAAEMRVQSSFDPNMNSSPFAAAGGATSITANRLSFVYGFSAPSMTIDTACSSGLVALDAALKAIYSNDCEMALVVGVAMIQSAEEFVPMCAAGMLSIKGRCSSFSDEADGYARGEGCAALVLKPLAKHGMPAARIGNSLILITSSQLKRSHFDPSLD